MKSLLPVIIFAPLVLTGCAWSGGHGTLAELRNVEIPLKDEQVADGLEKAMASYRRFLKETPESAMTPEAMRRIADLSIEHEYGYVAEDDSPAAPKKNMAKTELEAPETASHDVAITAHEQPGVGQPAVGESEKSFEERALRAETLRGESAQALATVVPEDGDDLANASAAEAIELYKKLLRKYPLYERNDQVLYQMSRAYEEVGQPDSAMDVMKRLVKAYPDSKYMDEVRFRMAEYYFTRRKFLDAESSYQAVVNMGSGSTYYELSLYKLGWSFYKQELYEEALHRYFDLLDYKVSIGYDFNQQYDETQGKRIEDTYRVISLSFSNLGGPQSVVDYFARNGGRGYEDKVYSHLGEFYLTKRRYSDAAESYKAFVGLYPFHEVSPKFNLRMIEIYTQGGFGQLVIQAKKDYATTYALDAEYWQHFDIASRPDVVEFVKTNLKDLASHYHALYQDPRFANDKQANYAEALVWYRNYLASFPQEEASPAMNYQMADLMLENGDFHDAAVAYENTAYNYPLHEKSAAAGYAAVYAYREYLQTVPVTEQGIIKDEVIRSSLKFADTYPEHEKVDVVLGAAADDLYETRNHELAVKTARRLIDNYPNAKGDLRRSAWLVIGHGSFELERFADAEKGYINVLDLTPGADDSRKDLMNNLAASIYKQGEQANEAEDYETAAAHFLRIGKLAPTSTIRPTAEYDGATALIALEDWERAAGVLAAFRKDYPTHELQSEVTKKIAFVYRSAGKLGLAAAEYERIERETTDVEVRRGALTMAAELYSETGARENELSVYKRYVAYFPKPVEQALEVYNKMSGAWLELGSTGNYEAVLKKIIEIDRSAGDARTDRTRYLGAQASLVLTRPLYDRFAAVKLVQPLKKNLDKKKKYMKAAIEGYTKLLDYEVADVTAAATYYMAEIYFHFNRALLDSERPKNLDDLEMSEYELALEEQAYPFEDKAIDVHRKNVELLHAGIYSHWIDKSIDKLAEVYPALYARAEERTGFVNTIDSFSYVVEPADAGKPKSEKETGSVDQGEKQADVEATNQTSTVALGG